MPKLEIDYSNTIFYKIYCIDPSINEMYIGHTTNFVQRKYAHKQGTLNIKSSNYNCKLYNVIRSNKGWDNWKMEIIAFHECADLMSAKKYEQQYFEEYKATLNSVEPLPKPKPKINKVVVKKDKQEPLYCDVCNIYVNSAKNQEIHDKTNNVRVEKTKFYTCINCNFSCSKNSDFIRHCNTKKHNATNNDGMLKCRCGKKYKHHSSYYRHKSRCNITPEHAENTAPNNQTNSELITKLLMQNQDLILSNQQFKELIVDQQHENQKLQNKLIEAVKDSGNTINNNNTTNG
jgi:hypothetical protein